MTKRKAKPTETVTPPMGPVPTFGFDGLKAQADPSNEIMSLMAELRRAREELRSVRVDAGDVSNLFTAIVMAIRDTEQVLPPSPSLYTHGRTNSVGSPCAAVAHWTDWHVGACQEADEIEGVNAFSPSILDDRIEVYNEKIVNQVELHRSVYDVPTLHIIDTGDNISGDIHEELRITNAYPAPVQCVQAGQMKARKIAKLAQHFNEVVVHFLVADNHSRLSKKPQAKQESTNSFNYIVGFIAKTMLEQHKNVTFNLIPSNRSVISVSTRQYLITHGHDIKGWAGIPWYGIERLVGSESKARFHDPVERRFHKIIMGHWHTAMWTPHYFIGPSPQGTDAYDHKNGRRSLPGQNFFFVHPRHGEFDMNVINL